MITFFCSFCEKQIKCPAEKIGIRAQCPSCKKIIRLFDNSSGSIVNQLTHVFYIKKPKLVLLKSEIGPLTEIEFVDHITNVEKGVVDDRYLFRSESITGGNWVKFDQIPYQQIKEIAAQKNAELIREKKVAIRNEEEAQKKATADEENKTRLRHFLKQAISDGQLSSDEQSLIESFVSKAKLDPVEVKRIIAEESEALVMSLFEDALDDGILSPDEEERILQYCTGLGFKLDLDQEKKLRAHAAKLAYTLNMTEVDGLQTLQMEVD